MNRRRLRATRSLLPWLCLIAFATTCATTYRLTSPDPVAFAATLPAPAAVRPPVETRHLLEQRIVDGWRCTNTARAQLGLRPYPRPKRVWRYGAILWQVRCETYTKLVAEARRDPLVAMRLTFPPGTWERWERVIGCETGGTFSNAVVGAAGETSAFQVHPASHPWYDAQRGHTDALYGARAAHRVWTSAGWGAWTCARLLGIAA